MQAFIDESGQRGTTARSSDHFVLSAVVLDPGASFKSAQLLALLRNDLGRGPNDELHWRKLKTHDEKVRAAQLIGGSPFLYVCSVVVCKRKFQPLAPKLPRQDLAYMFTFRLLLERLSWLAKQKHSTLEYTLAHIIRFKVATLRQYEEKLREMETKIWWKYLDPHGGRFSTPKVLEQLQLADLTASAIAEAFEPNRFGNTENRYLLEIRPRIWVSGAITGSGLKMHPWNNAVKAAHPLVETL